MMEKRIVICGSRNYTKYNEAKIFLDACLSEIKKENNIIIISGGAKGADTLGESYAKEKGYRVERYPADWKRFGKAAGVIRNKKMAEISDLIICFWDGKSRGTASMIRYAKKLKKTIKIKLI